MKTTVIRVQDVMQKHFIIRDGVETVDNGLKALIAEDAHTLIIRKRHDDDEYGIVLLSDIAKQVLAQNRAPERVNLYEIMTKPVIGISPTMDIRYCSRLFDQFGINTAPVIKDGDIVGIVTFKDIVLNGLAKQLT
jgi:predicted transcriptional regulator